MRLQGSGQYRLNQLARWWFDARRQNLLFWEKVCSGVEPAAGWFEMVRANEHQNSRGRSQVLHLKRRISGEVTETIKKYKNASLKSSLSTDDGDISF